MYEEESLRRDFARIFGWYKTNQNNYNTREPRETTWAEIFVEIGRLQAAEDNHKALMVEPYSER